MPYNVPTKTTAPVDTVYLLHHYGRDDWHGTGTPFATLAGAIAHSDDTQDTGTWVDAHTLMPDVVTEPGTEWWPTEEYGEPFRPGVNDDHAYITVSAVFA